MTLVKFGLLLHGLLALSATAMITHLWIWSLRGKASEQKISRYTLWVSLSYAGAFLLGSIIYPTFRTTVRVSFDTAMPVATILFEIKEHLLSINLLIVILLFVLRRDLWSGSGDMWRFGSFLAGISSIIMWYASLVGLTLTIIRPI